MKKIIDMSGPIQDGAEWFGPPCEPVRIRDIGSIEKEGWVSHVIHMTTISGTTYVETGGHLFPEGPKLEDIPPERLILEANVWHCDVEGRAMQAPREAGSGGDMRGEALVVLCGWHSAWNREDFASESPFFGEKLQEAILSCRPSILASDSVHFDAPEAAEMPFLRKYFRTGGMIVSPLCPREDLPRGRGRLIVAPLRLVGVNSSPCRVFFE